VAADAKLWRILIGADYGPLNAAARGKIDPPRIERQWPDILRVVASIHTGAVPAYDILRVLAPGARRRSWVTRSRTTGGSSRRCTSCPRLPRRDGRPARRAGPDPQHDHPLEHLYLDHALDQLRATGYPVLDADVARPSPYMRRHINFHWRSSPLRPCEDRAGEVVAAFLEVAHALDLAAVGLVVDVGRSAIEAPAA